MSFIKYMFSKWFSTLRFWQKEVVSVIIGYGCSSINIPKQLLDTTTEKKSKLISEYRNPHILILWEGYKSYFKVLESYYRANSHMADIDCPLEFLGLKIEWTDIPDTIEVY